ncbi:hypothetical protein [Intestinibacter sp.]|uniref:hypothetical protein n=1 Tax=Intestinibacter sp. TaxID=1965304 RepID=UPI003F13E125
MKKIQEKIMDVKGKIIKTSLIAGSILGISYPVYAEAGKLELENMKNVSESLKNIIGYAATIFIAGGSMAALWGAYTFFQGLRSQDGEAKQKATIEVAAGLGAVVVGSAAQIFKNYIS